MEIATLKDLKIALKDIPDEVLVKFGLGLDNEGNSHNIDLLCWDDSDPHVEYGKATEKYPLLKDIGRWITASMQEERKFVVNPEDDTLWERDTPISSKEVSVDSLQG